MTPETGLHYERIHHLQKAEALRAGETTYLPPRKTTLLPLKISKANVLENSSLNIFGIHIRSRFAHVGLDIEDALVPAFIDLLQTEGAQETGTTVGEFPLINRGDSPILVYEDDGVFHAFGLSARAKVVGKKLEQAFASHPNLGHSIVLGYSQNKEGQRIATHVFAKASDEKFYLPEQPKPIIVGHLPTFEEVRSELYHKYFQRIDAADIQPNQLYIAAMPEIVLPENRYIIIGAKAYSQTATGDFIETGVQLHSPLVEGRSNTHGHNLELINGNWVKFEMVRNGSELTPG